MLAFGSAPFLHSARAKTAQTLACVRVVALSALLLPALSACDYSPKEGVHKSSSGPTSAQVALLARPAWVADAANVIPADDEARMVDNLAQLEARTGHQLVVVTVPALGEKRIDEYAFDLAQQWGIGREGYDDGAMIMLAPQERRAYVTLGSGLQCRLSAEREGEIFSAMTIHFDEENFSTGLNAGVKAMIEDLDAIPNDTREWAAKINASNPSDPIPCTAEQQPKG